MSSKKIFVADDDASIVDAIQLILEDAGYTVKTTVDGKTVQDMQQELPDLLLLDIWMSGMDGSKICAHLKAQPRTKNIPIIIVSANKDTKSIALDCGADDFLSKPFDMHELLDKVAKHL
jgi:DNA-binding response OmpR family regulator